MLDERQPIGGDPVGDHHVDDHTRAQLRQQAVSLVRARRIGVALDDDPAVRMRANDHLGLMHNILRIGLEQRRPLGEEHDTGRRLRRGGLRGPR